MTVGGLVVVAALLWASSATALEIEPLGVIRLVSPDVSDGIRSESLGLFEESVSGAGSGASQVSLLTPTTATGSGSIHLDAVFSQAHSTLHFSFEVPTTQRYSLSGELGMTGFIDFLYVRLSSTTRVSLFEHYEGAYETDLVLEAGEIYTLNAVAQAFHHGGQITPTGFWSFTLVPEPASGWLSGIGLAALGALRRPRRSFRDRAPQLGVH